MCTQDGRFSPSYLSPFSFLVALWIFVIVFFFVLALTAILIFARFVPLQKNQKEK